MLPYKDLLPIYRPTTGDSNTYPETPTLYEYIFIQPQDPTLALTDVAFAKTFRAFAEMDANLKEMDQIEYMGKTMRINSISVFPYGTHKHLEITLELLY